MHTVAEQPLHKAPFKPGSVRRSSLDIVTLSITSHLFFVPYHIPCMPSSHTASSEATVHQAEPNDILGDCLCYNPSRLVFKLSMIMRVNVVAFICEGHESCKEAMQL